MVTAATPSQEEGEGRGVRQGVGGDDEDAAEDLDEHVGHRHADEGAGHGAHGGHDHRLAEQDGPQPAAGEAEGAHHRPLPGPLHEQHGHEDDDAEAGDDEHVEALDPAEAGEAEAGDRRLVGVGGGGGGGDAGWNVGAEGGGQHGRHPGAARVGAVGAQQVVRRAGDDGWGDDAAVAQHHRAVEAGGHHGVVGDDDGCRLQPPDGPQEVGDGHARTTRRRGCRSARRPAPAGACGPAPGRWPPVPARPPTTGRGAGRAGW